MLKRIVLTAALIAGMASPALAHRGHGGLTVIEIDPGSGAVSVSHRFAAHDVEPALPSIAPEAQPSLDDPRAVADLEAHLGARFRVAVDGAPVAEPGRRPAGTLPGRLAAARPGPVGSKNITK